ncbi:MAG: hypothetical protein ACKV0T_04360 [Planctomycetales bacterium]
MNHRHDGLELNEIELVRRGLTQHLADRLGLAGTTPQQRLRRVLLLIGVTWLPPAIFSWINGQAFGSQVEVPFFHDLEVHVRFLIVVPMLQLADAVVALSLAAQVRHLHGPGVVPESERGGLRAAITEAVAWRSSRLAEGLLAILAYVLTLALRLQLGLSEGKSSWERSETLVSVAGWWHILISLPVLYFLLLRWSWIFLVWARFLFRVSRLKLELTPTHPDRAGGLGFLGWGMASFGTVLMAVAAVISSAMIHQIVHLGDSLEDMKYHVMVFVVGALVVLHAPLLAFSGQLARCRFAGMLEFGALAWRHDRAFDEKWVQNPPADLDQQILGSADIQSLADMATCYEHVDRMRLLPFDTKASIVLAGSIVLPMLPLVGTAIPVAEIVSKLSEFLI